MDSLNKTRSLFYIKVHEAKKELIKDIGPVNRIHLTVLVSVRNTYILCIACVNLKVDFIISPLYFGFAKSTRYFQRKAALDVNGVNVKESCPYVRLTN